MPTRVSSRRQPAHAARTSGDPCSSRSSSSPPTDPPRSSLTAALTEAGPRRDHRRRPRRRCRGRRGLQPGHHRPGHADPSTVADVDRRCSGATTPPRGSRCCAIAQAGRPRRADRAARGGRRRRHRQAVRPAGARWPGSRRCRCGRSVTRSGPGPRARPDRRPPRAARDHSVQPQGRRRDDDDRDQPRARRGRARQTSVLLIDLDLSFGQVASHLNLQPKQTLLELSATRPRCARPSCSGPTRSTTRAAST